MQRELAWGSSESQKTATSGLSAARALGNQALVLLVASSSPKRIPPLSLIEMKSARSRREGPRKLEGDDALVGNGVGDGAARQRVVIEVGGVCST